MEKDLEQFLRVKLNPDDIWVFYELTACQEFGQFTTQETVRIVLAGQESRVVKSPLDGIERIMIGPRGRCVCVAVKNYAWNIASIEWELPVSRLPETIDPSIARRMGGLPTYVNFQSLKNATKCTRIMRGYFTHHAEFLPIKWHQWGATMNNLIERAAMKLIADTLVGISV